MLGAYITHLPGASRWFAGGVVAYDNRIKMRLLGIEADLLQTHGAVSEQVARHMAQGVCKLLHVHAAISITGIAGPDGGSPKKPVGFIWIGCSLRGLAQARSFQFQGSREQVRQAACAEGLRYLLAQFSQAPSKPPSSS
jgi:nicotinamide-nucleotide amidase